MTDDSRRRGSTRHIGGSYAALEFIPGHDPAPTAEEQAAQRAEGYERLERLRRAAASLNGRGWM